MHIITKILVVFAAAFSLALAALTSVYALNADSIVSAYNDKNAEALQATANYELQSSQFADLQAELNSQLRSKDEEIADLDRERAALESEIIQLQIAAKEANDRAARIERQIGDLSKTADTQATFVQTLTGEVSTLREEGLDIKNQNIDLLARINDLESENDVLTQTNRALQVTIADLQSQLDGGPTIAGGGAAAPPDSPAVISGPPVFGRVQAVREVNGQLLAEVDLGSRDRVRENSKLFITRNDRWLADLVIVRTDIQSSVGRVDVLGRTGIEIREGDIVLSSLGG
ncbi:MAG: hypothetical protein AAGB48_11480 [Planctomycetota bacterium]